MKKAIILTLLCCLPMAANAVILSFDAVTGSAEALTDGSETDVCSDSDICASALTFANIGASGISATITSNTAADGSGTTLWDWYDLQPANLGGMGAASQAQSGTDSSADNAVGEYIIVRFSQAVSLDNFWMNGGIGTSGHALYNATGNLYLAGVLAEAVGCDDSFCDNTDLVGTSFSFLAAPAANGTHTPYYLAGIGFRAIQTPEPAIVTLLGLGLMGLAIVRRKKY